MQVIKNQLWRDNPEIVISEFIKSNVAVSVTDKIGRIIYVNDHFCSITGYLDNELIGETNKLFKSKIHKDPFYKDLWKIIGRGHIWKGVVTNNKKSGEVFHLETTIVPLKDDAGNIENFIAMYLDITSTKKEYKEAANQDFKRLEIKKKLKENEAKFRSLFHSVKFGIIVVTDDMGVITDFNKGAELAFGYTSTEIIGSYLTKLMPFQYRNTSIKQFVNTINSLRTDKTIETIEMKVMKKNGDEFPVELILNKWKKGSKLNYCAMMLDISKLKNLEIELQQKTKELELLITRSSHDLKQSFASTNDIVKSIKEMKKNNQEKIR